uniref:Cytochrome c oxidase subunit 3 n=1 Tax=Megalodontes quinquecinctus TaxID=2491145 RepID=A0A3S8V101_9HYME|nr:cytochrome c oxidase subunit 3 [Megalodontes quinquecinctus]
MSNTQNHPFHLVNPSPWPITSSSGLMIMLMGMIMWFHYSNLYLIFIGKIIILLSMYQWWRDVIRESTYQGNHTMIVTNGLRMGMILFIISEVFFFISFFWTYFHMSLSPDISIGIQWPPKGILPFNPFKIPLLNTIILISSGISVTWAHHSILNNNYINFTNAMNMTIFLGMIFTLLQLFEYYEAPFSISDSVYGSIFFLTTGFHGIHVIIGTTFLLICLIRHKYFHFSNHHHFGFEASAWYWHFVDIVWLFLYISIYWWGK